MQEHKTNNEALELLEDKEVISVKKKKPLALVKSSGTKENLTSAGTLHRDLEGI